MKEVKKTLNKEDLTFEQKKHVFSVQENENYDKDLVNWLFDKFINAGKYPDFTQEEFFLLCETLDKSPAEIKKNVESKEKKNNFYLRCILDFRVTLLLFMLFAVNVFFYNTNNQVLYIMVFCLLFMKVITYLYFKFVCFLHIIRLKFIKKTVFFEMFNCYKSIKEKKVEGIDDCNVLFIPPGEHK